MEALCVLMGANIGKNPAYAEAAVCLGKELAKRKITLIYGGGRLGLMGVLANTVLDNGGKVIGVITEHLYEKEAHLGLTELKIVDSMQERKRLMVEISDGFIALPGGLGTLEEIFEIWNAAKLKIHNKPLGLLNIEAYFDKLIDFVGYSVQEEFLSKESSALIEINEDPMLLINLLIDKNTSIQQKEQKPIFLATKRIIDDSISNNNFI